MSIPELTLGKGFIKIYCTFRYLQFEYLWLNNKTENLNL